MQNNSPFTIHLEHPDFFVVEKPAGLNFHSEDGELGFFSQFKKWMEESGNGAVFSVHRLDKVTSGLIIVARSQEASSQFAKLFREKKIEKFYLALSAKKPKKKQGTVTGDMAKSRRGSYKLLHSKENPAITQFFSFGTDIGVRLFLVKLLTGKTHQIRVALKSLGSPILGDPLYTIFDENIKRCYLHSFFLKFRYLNQKFEVISYPNDELFKEVLERVDECEIEKEGEKVRIKKPVEYPWPKVKRS